MTAIAVIFAMVAVWSGTPALAQPSWQPPEPTVGPEAAIPRNRPRVVITESAPFAKKAGKWVEGKRVAVRKTTYSPQGVPVDDEKFLPSGALVSKTVCTLDEFGRVAEKTIFETPAQKLTGRESYRYDGRGRLIEVQRSRGDGTAFNASAFEYNERGKPTRETITPAGGGAPWIVAYTYDQNDREATITCTGPDGKQVWKHAYQYDDNGHCTEDKAWRHGSLISNTRYTYDAKGDLAKLVVYRGDGQLMTRHTFKATYDSKGNWTKRTTYDTRFFKPRWVEVSYRVITYHP